MVAAVVIFLETSKTFSWLVFLVIHTLHVSCVGILIFLFVQPLHKRGVSPLDKQAQLLTECSGYPSASLRMQLECLHM